MPAVLGLPHRQAPPVREAEERNGDALGEQQSAGLTEDERRRVMPEFTDRVRASSRYPRLIALIGENYDPDAARSRDGRFELGLDGLLGGIAARVWR
jgi:hypothetical protein